MEQQRPPSKVLSAQRLAVAMREAAEGFHGPAQGIGIDAEDSKTFVKASETFLDRNFTTAERRCAEETVGRLDVLVVCWLFTRCCVVPSADETTCLDFLGVYLRVFT